MYLNELLKEFWIEKKDLQIIREYFAEYLEEYKSQRKNKYSGMSKDGKKLGSYMNELVLQVLKANLLIELWEELMSSTSQL